MSVAVIPTSEIGLDPERFQFRRLRSRTGSQGRLRGVKRWNPDLAGVIAVWRDPADERIWCVNGHHRLNLARMHHVPEVAVLFVSAETDSCARAVGAMINLAEGSGDATDFAKVLRDGCLTGTELQSQGITPASELVSQAVALSNLDDGPFAAVVAGRLPVAVGVLVGKVADPARQAELLALRAQLGWSEALLAEAAELAAQAERMDTIQASFLEAPSPTDLSIRLGVRAAVRARLRSQRRALDAACQRTSAQWLRAANCTIDQREARTQRSHAERLLGAFDRLANRPGPLCDVLGELAAETIATGVSPEKVVAKHWSLLSDVILGGELCPAVA